MSTNADENQRALAVVRERLSEATGARKCHGCGCLHETVRALEHTEVGRRELGPVLSEARGAFEPRKYDCLGCPVCHPAIAVNALAEAFPGEGEALDPCATEEPDERHGWPPLPGDYYVLRYRAPVAICTLNSEALAARIAERSPESVALVGTLHTENLGIERVIRNVLADPHIRFLVVCGEDTRQAIGHLPGQSLVSLFENGLDERGRIIGARGKRPLLKNVRRDQVEDFRGEVEPVSLIGEERDSVILERAAECAARDPGPRQKVITNLDVPIVAAAEPRRLVPDPYGYFVVCPDASRDRLIVEHYTTDGVLDCVLGGATPSALYSTAIERNLVSRLDHAAYLGRELARAHRSLETGEPYVQDRAAGEITAEPIKASGGTRCGGTPR